jgi:hypothetical protein
MLTGIRVNSFRCGNKKSPFFEEKELPGAYPPETPFSSMPNGRI